MKELSEEILTSKGQCRLSARMVILPVASKHQTVVGRAGCFVNEDSGFRGPLGLWGLVQVMSPPGAAASSAKHSTGTRWPFGPPPHLTFEDRRALETQSSFARRHVTDSGL